MSETKTERELCPQHQIRVHHDGTDYAVQVLKSEEGDDTIPIRMWPVGVKRSLHFDFHKDDIKKLVEVLTFVLKEKG